jgi:hypothetical protein
MNNDRIKEFALQSEINVDMIGVQRFTDLLINDIIKSINSIPNDLRIRGNGDTMILKLTEGILVGVTDFIEETYKIVR